ncbi:MAG: Trm112 family protein [Planctomycetota bacterium]
MNEVPTEGKNEASGPAPPIPEELLDILVCPLGKAPLRLEGGSLVCTKCGLAYAIEDGIANMLVEEAKLPPGVASIEELPCYLADREPGGR